MADPRHLLIKNTKDKISIEENFISEGINLEDCVPLKWDQYFEKKEFITTNDGKFNILHSGSNGPLCVLIHGAGSSAETWCLFVKELLEIINVIVIAIDLRGHGETVTRDDSSLEKSVLVDDIINVINLYCQKYNINKEIVLIGHSLGGSLVTSLAETIKDYTILGLIVIDVDEDAALDHDNMLHLIDKRRNYFTSIEKAIKYSYDNRKIKNLEVDRIVIPSQIVQITPDDENNSKSRKSYKYTWRTNLFETRPFWIGWFKGFSHTFTTLKVPRVIVLTSFDRLDRTLLIGQMQGLFMVEKVDHCGHSIQEDDPKTMAEIVEKFFTRQRILN